MSSMIPFCRYGQGKRLTISPSLVNKAERNTGIYVWLYLCVFWILLARSYVIANNVINVRVALVTKGQHMSRHASHITVTVTGTVTLIHKRTYCPQLFETSSTFHVQATMHRDNLRINNE